MRGVQSNSLKNTCSLMTIGLHSHAGAWERDMYFTHYQSAFPRGSVGTRYFAQDDVQTCQPFMRSTLN